MKKGFVYIITNEYHSVLYTGVTSNLEQRVYKHKKGVFDGFSKKYNLKKLVWYEECLSIHEAIIYEKVLKGWSRIKKITLVNKSNPYWNDLLSFRA